VAIHPPLVIARSEATWQSIFQVVQDSRWIASPSARNDVGWLAMIRVLVIARSVATWQSIFQVVQDLRWIASPSARNDPNSCHCEERSDAAIHTNHVIARSKATWQSIFQVVQDLRWIASPPARNDGGDGSQ